MVALLALILGIWLWDNHFSKPMGYAPGTEEIALIKIDRDLRLADAMQDDPALLRWLAGVSTAAEARDEALAVLRKLASYDSLSGKGVDAYAILKAADGALPLRESVMAATHGEMSLDFMEASAALATYRGSWWQARWLAEIEKDTPFAREWRGAFHQGSSQLRARALIARSSVWLLGVAGLVFIPRTLGILKHGLSTKPSGYGGAWSANLGISIFLISTLAWIGFTQALETGISALPGVHPLAAILLDSAARLVPALIALAFVFKRPSHVVRVLGLGRPFSARAILGLFSLLMVIDLIIQPLLGNPATPGAGLNTGEAGLWGLAFVIASACLLAPLTEEVIYRGVLFRSLWGRWGTMPATLFAAALFAVIHFYDGYGLLSVAFLGVACSLLYASTGSLRACIALHILYNASIKLPEWLIYRAPLG